MRSILCPEHCTPYYPATSTRANQGCGTECAFPLTADVVGLPCEHTWDVGVSGSNSEENTSVTNTNVVRESHHWKADKREDTVGDNPWGANVVFVTSVRKGHHDKRSKDVGRCDQTVGCRRAEAHAVLENDRKEVRNGIGDGGGEHEDQGEAPDLEIKRTLAVASEVELLGNNVMAILLNAGYDKVDFILVEELLLHLAWLSSQLGKVDDEVPADKTDGDGDNTLEDKYPAPASNTRTEANGCLWCLLGWAVVNTEPGGGLVTMAAEQREQVTQNSGEGGREHANEEEDGVALLEFESLVPAREEIGGACIWLAECTEERVLKLVRAMGYVPGKKPASKIPRRRRRGSSVCHSTER